MEDLARDESLGVGRNRLFRAMVRGVALFHKRPEATGNFRFLF